MKTTLTIDESGQELTETHGGVDIPANYSFKCINDFVHRHDVQFEDLQCLCLSLATYIQENK